MLFVVFRLGDGSLIVFFLSSQLFGDHMVSVNRETVNLETD